MVTYEKQSDHRTVSEPKSSTDGNFPLCNIILIVAVPISENNMDFKIFTKYQKTPVRINLRKAGHLQGRGFVPMGATIGFVGRGVENPSRPSPQPGDTIKPAKGPTTVVGRVPNRKYWVILPFFLAKERGCALPILAVYQYRNFTTYMEKRQERELWLQFSRSTD